MRVMVLIKATEESEKGFFKTPETMKMMEEMGKYNDELRNAGIPAGGISKEMAVTSSYYEGLS